MDELPPASATGFWSIERFVAFVVGPAATAGSGWLSTWIAERLGAHIAGPEILGVFATGGLAAAGLAYKWLHGRQLEQSLQPALQSIETMPYVGNLVHTTLHDLEGLATNAANQALAGVTKRAPQDSAAEESAVEG